MINTGFSIVLCSFNGISRLRTTLFHLSNLCVPYRYCIELVFVDNASTEDVIGFVKKIWNELNSPYSLVLVSEPRTGKGYAVEAGYDAAKYSYVLTVDDDNWLAPDYLIKAERLFFINSDIKVLQGRSEGYFETDPPEWIKDRELYFIIGAPVNEPGFYPENKFDLWGAGMIFERQDWLYLRSIGFSFLTSKLPGKAAGEDSELALALVLLGRRPYYSPDLTFKHFMPAGRITWGKLQTNFEVLGYVNYFMTLYETVVSANRKGQVLDKRTAKKEVLRRTFRSVNWITPKQHLAYWLISRQETYQLMLTRFYSQLKWYNRLSGHIMQDVNHIQRWMLPLLKENQRFNWPW